MEESVAVCPRNILTHLQQLQEWQKDQQRCLKEIQQENWKQLHQGKEKLQQLLDPILSQGPSSSDRYKKNDGSDKSKNLVLSSKTSIKCPSSTVHPSSQKITKSSADNPSFESEVGPAKRKPFPFLKKGNGLVRYKSLARSTTTKTCPKNISSKSTLPHEQKKFPFRQSVKKLKFKRVTFQEKNDNIITLDSPIDDAKTSDIKIVDNRSHENLLLLPSSKTRQLPTEKDAEDLVEFEILEQVAHNCSLDSDSSLVNRLLTIGMDSEEGKDTQQETTEPEIRYPSVQTDSDVISPAVLHQVLDTSLSSIEDLSESSKEPSLPVSSLSNNSNNKEMAFDELNQWRDDSVLDWSASSPPDASSEEETQKEFAKAFQDARKELLIMTECGPDKDRLLLQERLKDLEEEIAAFRKENTFLSKLKAQHKQIVKDFEKEKTLFKKKQDEEEKKFNEVMKEEKKKLRNQQQVFEKHWKARQDHPDKKEREEIAALKAEVQRLEEDIKKQRVHLSAECGRLRTHISSVECEKEKLHTQLQKVQQEKEQLAKELKIKEATIVSLNKEKKQSQSKTTLVKKDVQVLINPKKKITVKSNLKQGGCIKKNVQPELANTRLNGNFIKKDEEKKKSKEEEKPYQIKGVHFSQERQPMISETEQTNEYEKELKPEDVVEEIQHFDKIERILHSGEREFIYSSGTRKILSADGSTSQIFFYNGDVMITLSDKTEVYHFAESGTKQTCYLDGTVLLEYADGQEEKRYKTGMKQQKYKDGTVHVTYPDGIQEIRAPDGTLLKIQKDGEEVVEFTNGERELRTKDFKRREYLNGSSKTIYNDGREETCYPNGRVRLKDKDGNVLMDTKYKR